MAGGGSSDEGVLVEALRRGDEAAFAQLVDELNGPLTRLALAHVPSRAVAEDVVGDTWLGVIRGIDDFEGRSSLRTWIFQILLNNARTRGKREKRTLPFSSLWRRDPESRDEPAVDPSRFEGRHGEYPGHWSRPPVEWQAPESSHRRRPRRDAGCDREAARAPAGGADPARHARLLGGGSA